MARLLHTGADRAWNAFSIAEGSRMHRFAHDRRVPAAIMAFAALLLAGAVAFATSWLPSAGGSRPVLPLVVTSRPVESPLTTSVFTSPTPSAEVTAGAAATTAPEPKPAPRVEPKTGPAPAPRPKEGAKAAPKPDPGREVVTPPVRDEDDDDDDEESARPSSVKTLERDGGDDHDRKDDEREDSDRDDDARRDDERRRERSED